MEKLEFLLLKFTEYLKTSGFAEDSVKSYHRYVKYFLDFLTELGIKNIAETTRQILTDYQTRIYLQTFKGKPLSISSQNLRLNAVRTFYRYLFDTGQLLYDPSNSLKFLRRPQQLPKSILSKKEIGELLSAPNLETPLGVRDRAILEVFYGTGVRLAELCNLTLEDLDLSHGELRINQGKGKKDRLVPLGEMACDCLAAYLHYARPKMAENNQPALFVSKEGGRLCRSRIWRMIKRYTQLAKLSKNISPHALRHTCATHLLKGKADIRQIQELLGHNCISSTQIYTRVEITDLKKVLKRSHPRERKEIEIDEV